ncbi:nicotinate-nucleotide adenylyltransferase [Posidoniimonas polymericola]|uniref:nicotinate-nucleotide adenylyltransferase n=1 Tax=Posidoniimonas polymericola TaxID=2528002 RepID=UPI0021BC6DE2|nr:nicotinate-nucleotide adenylyltransferase [Posidoniimonas polymericola]
MFGGSFDPVHHGHLALARACRDAARLDEVWLVPAAVQPHKPHGPVAANEDRLAMLHLATDSDPSLRVSDLEIARGGVSYTVDTLRAVHDQAPDAELYLLMGADTLADLPKWREPEAIRQLASLLVVHRPGEPLPEVDGVTIVEMPLSDLSSSEIRRRVAAGESIEGMTPEGVAGYIAERGLYR